MLQRFDTRKYSVRDFEEWNDKGDLKLAPKFQRRDVWNPKARSYLIDTILRGKPIPKIYMRQTIDTKTRKVMREVVDGQQRLRSVLEFLKDGFKISRVHNEDFGGKYFSTLDEATKLDILRYEFSVDLLQDMPDEEVYEIFARMNTYSWTLNAQELRHAKHFGDFRTCVYTLVQEFGRFWETSKIFTNKAILRMAEAEYVSELLMAMAAGIRQKEKRSIDKFYEDNDDEFPHRKMMEKRFREVMDHIGGILADSIGTSSLTSTRLFYPFFCAVYHMQHGLPKLDDARIAIKPISHSKIRSSLQQIDILLQRVKKEGKGGNLDFLTSEQSKFFAAYNEHWVHAENRRLLTRHIGKLIRQSMK